MSQEEATSGSATTQAADWVSTALSVPLIWPKTTALVSLAVIALGVGLVLTQLMGPSLPPPPPLDRQRIAEIERHIQQADALARNQTPPGHQTTPSPYLGYMHAIGDPDHAERNHQESVHAH